MSRLETMRTFWIERFFGLLTGDPEFAGLAEPAELFTSAGAFNAPPTAAGFTRVPTLDAIRNRITTSSSPQREGLERFERVLTRALTELFGSLSTTTAKDAIASALRSAPVIRHPDNQTYWPVNGAELLKYDDGALIGRLYDSTGTRQLASDLFSTLFENASAGSGGAKAPFQSRIPFAASIGIEPGVSPFPGSSLTAGRLNLSAADPRLTPGMLQPTIYAEMKSLTAAIRNNRHYAASALKGRFAELRRNRFHTDPLLTGVVVSEASRAQRVPDPILVIYHAFYPADDGARRVPDGTGTNREFHHLAVGRLITGQRATTASSRSHELFFLSASPTEARVLPLGHPALGFVDDSGRETKNGGHPVVYANMLSPQGFDSNAELEKSGLKETAKSGLDYDPDSAAWWLGLAAAVGVGAAAGSAGGPIGAVIGAAVGLVVYLLAWLLKKLFGGKKDRKKEWTEQKPWPGGDGRPVQQNFTQGASHDIGPPGATSQSGGTQPGRSYELRLIPHFPDENLYGLEFAGGDRFRIVDDADHRETLAWWSFEGGIGYQFARPAPGRAEAAGSSLCNYFELFTRKYLDLQQASSQVQYFGA
jgi:hypothetical protein